MSTENRWQSPETLFFPADGCFDVWVEHEHEVGKGHRRANCSWQTNLAWPPEAPRAGSDRSLRDAHGFTISYPWRVTHWAPLPAAPSLTGSSRESEPLMDVEVLGTFLGHEVFIRDNAPTEVLDELRKRLRGVQCDSM